MTFWERIGAQLRRPHGRSGEALAAVMRVVNAAAYRAALKALALQAGETVLEVGCGGGDGVAALLRCKPEAVVGLDASATMIARARRRNGGAVAAGLLDLIEADAAAIPLASNSVDAVLAVNVAYFFDDPGCLQEIHRVLKPGGRVVLYVSDRSVMQSWPFAGAETHRLYDAASLRAALVEAGFATGSTRVVRLRVGGVPGLVAVGLRAQAGTRDRSEDRSDCGRILSH
ncbi:MAG: class I SAM-dependent methyltransferase [Hyphomicrobiales bacterium]